MCDKSLVIGVDPGSDIVGMALLRDNGIEGAFNLSFPAFWGKIEAVAKNSESESLTMVVEDLAPYSMQVTQQVIDTAKFIGELTFRVNRDYPNVNLVLIKRSAVKKWIFDSFPDLAGPLVAAKIDKKLFSACRIADKEEIRVDVNGRLGRKGSFNYVDDRIVKAAMAYLYKIPKPPPGAGYLHGIKDHAWQALAAASVFTGKIK